MEGGGSLGIIPLVTVIYFVKAMRYFMKRESLVLEKDANGRYRAVFRTKHCRKVFIELEFNGEAVTVTDCFYIDRSPLGSVRPLMLVTLEATKSTILDVIERELDRKFHGLELTESWTSRLSPEGYAEFVWNTMRRNYNILILVGEGETVNDLPAVLKTRYKNCHHRAIYLVIKHASENQGTIEKCQYYDRKYKNRKRVVAPEKLNTYFFEYTKKAILNLVNSETDCDFTHVLITRDTEFAVDFDTTPLCGHI